MSDSKNILEEIAKLKDSINKYREAKHITSNAPYRAFPVNARGRGSYRARGSYRDRTRKGYHPARNRTLIVNHNEDNNSQFVSTTSSKSFKLINKEVYQKELQSKNLSKEEKKDALEEAKAKILKKKLETRISKNRVKLDLADRCMIDGELFAISRFGAKLVCLDVPTGTKTKHVKWNGYNYIRTKAGNLALLNRKVFLKEQCRYFQKTGECSKISTCRYAHNHERVRLCRNFLNGSCMDNKCKLSHEPNDHNVPNCYHFLKGNCQNEHCQYLHVAPELELICRPFSIGGYCFRGKKCLFRHSYECPDYQLTRECSRGKGCKLKHLEKDNLDSRLIFNTLDPEVLLLPNLTQKVDGNFDPRIPRDELIENEDDINYSDDEDEDYIDNDIPIVEEIDDSLKNNEDFIQF
ncbi:hypothetical protein WICMUC_001565 [Wickerhamomyces mucosus]|uniref:C3H1-type domain-containing protein n=1 Tax=Wickerhamomyces mucosus TaxID=1378264 RepID=A0A9P8PTY5_9ASCO|nr:hypothetical protein WICMUC_001565 [Wickerhamomyces mucosus]